MRIRRSLAAMSNLVSRRTGNRAMGNCAFSPSIMLLNGSEPAIVLSCHDADHFRGVNGYAIRASQGYKSNIRSSRIGPFRASFRAIDIYHLSQRGVARSVIAKVGLRL